MFLVTLILDIPLLRSGVMQKLLTKSVNLVKVAIKFFHCNVFIFKNKRQTSNDINIANRTIKWHHFAWCI